MVGVVAAVKGGGCGRAVKGGGCGRSCQRWWAW